MAFLPQYLELYDTTRQLVERTAVQSIPKRGTNK